MADSFCKYFDALMKMGGHGVHRKKRREDAIWQDTALHFTINVVYL